MTVLSQGLIIGALPAPSSAAYEGLVHEVLIAPNSAATADVSIKQGTNIIAQFNAPGATGAMDPPLKICSPKGSLVDPTQFSTTGQGAYVTYFVE